MLSALAGASILALSTGASAQTAGAEQTAAPAEAATLGEVIVTARRRTEVLQDVPVSINAVTSQELSKLNIRKFEDIQTVVPGLSLVSNANGIGATASVRGVNFDVNASGNNGTVEFYLNDAPISAGNLFQAMFDVGQVELLRGPQGTLRGRASPSGSMTVTTTQPNLSQYGGYVTGTVTDIGSYNANGAVNIPIIKDMLAVRVAGIWDENQVNRVSSIHSQERPLSRTTGGRISARFDPTADLTFGVTYQQLNQAITSFDQVESLQALDPSAPASPAFIQAKDRLAVEDAPRRIHQRFDNLNLQAQWSVPGIARLNYVGAMNRQVFNSLDVSDKGDFFPPGFGANPTLFMGYGQFTHSYSKNWAHEVRVTSEEPVFGMVDYIFGGFYQKQDVPTNLTQQTAVLFGQPVLSNGLVVADPRQLIGGLIVSTPIARNGGSLEKSLFGNLTVHIGDATEVSGGARYIDYKSDGTLLVNNVINPAATSNTHDNTVIYQFQAKHKFGDDLMTYFSFGTSWRPPIDVIGDFSLARSPLENSFLQLDPEKSKSYEIGFKSNFNENRGRLNLSLFHQNFKNYPYRSASGVFFVETAAVGATTVQRVTNFNFVAPVPVKVNGLELELGYQIQRNWSFDANVAYAKSKIKDGLVPCNDYFPHDGVPDTVSTIPTVAQIQAATGGGTISACNVDFRAQITPPWSGNVVSEYYLPVTDTMDGYLRGLLTVYGKNQNDPSNPVDNVSAYALLNLYAGVRDPKGGWDVAFYAKNITNTEKVLARGATALTTPFNVLAASNTGITTYRGGSATFGLVMTQPREVGINVRYAFGSR